MERRRAGHTTTVPGCRAALPSVALGGGTVFESPSSSPSPFEGVCAFRGHTMSAALRYEGAAQFRYRLLCSTLSGRPLRIDNIREGEDQPGLKGTVALAGKL